MNTTTTAIATKLNVLESAIVRIEEWASVMFVVVKGLGARFVSKKAVEAKPMNVNSALIEERIDELNAIDLSEEDEDIRDQVAEIRDLEIHILNGLMFLDITKKYESTEELITECDAESAAKLDKLLELI